MNNDEIRIKLKDHAICVICGESVTAPPFVASKPRRGAATIYAHTGCLEKEQREIIYNKSLAVCEVLAQQGGGET